MIFYDFLDSNSVRMNQLTVLVGLISILVGFVFRAIAVYTMSKRAGLENRWLAFIPFANWILLGKLLGTCYVFRMKLKNLGVFVCIFSALNILMNIAFNLGQYMDAIFVPESLGQLEIVGSDFLSTWYQWSYGIVTTNLQGMVYYLVRYLYLIIRLISVVLTFFLVINIFRKYDPKRSLVFAILSIFFDFLPGIFLFAIRNNVPVNFQEYIREENRKRYAEMNRNQGGFGGENPSYRKPESADPFPEFESKDDRTYNPYEEKKESTDKKDEDDLFY